MRAETYWRLTNWLGVLKPGAGGWAEGSVRPAMVRFPMQPVNSYSNATYPMAGWFVYGVVGTPESFVFALAMSVLGVGSFLYHAWPSTRTAALDNFGMYAVFISLTTFVVGGGWLAMAVGASVGAYLLRYAFTLNLNVMMGVFLWFGVVATFPGRDVVLSIIAFAVAFAAWQADRWRVRFVGRWGHGAWHVLTAAAIAFMFSAAA